MTTLKNLVGVCGVTVGTSLSLKGIGSTISVPIAECTFFKQLLQH